MTDVSWVIWINEISLIWSGLQHKGLTWSRASISRLHVHVTCFKITWWNISAGFKTPLVVVAPCPVFLLKTGHGNPCPLPIVGLPSVFRMRYCMEQYKGLCTAQQLTWLKCFHLQEPCYFCGHTCQYTCSKAYKYHTVNSLTLCLLTLSHL